MTQNLAHEGSEDDVLAMAGGSLAKDALNGVTYIQSTGGTTSCQRAEGTSLSLDVPLTLLKSLIMS